MQQKMPKLMRNCKGLPIVVVGAIYKNSILIEVDESSDPLHIFRKIKYLNRQTVSLHNFTRDYGRPNNMIDT